MLLELLRQRGQTVSAAGWEQPATNHCSKHNTEASLAQEELLPTEGAFGDNLKSHLSWDSSPASYVLAGKVLSITWRFLCCLTRASRGSRG